MTVRYIRCGKGGHGQHDDGRNDDGHTMMRNILIMTTLLHMWWGEPIVLITALLQAPLFTFAEAG